MSNIKYYEASDFKLEDLCAAKDKKKMKVYVVFSTFGEREAGLIYDKISLLRRELNGYIDRIFLSHRREGNKIEETEEKARQADKDIEILICNDMYVPDMGKEKGKGADMRRTLYKINKEFRDETSGENIIVVFLDADVVEEYFGTHFVTGLTGAVMRGFDFVKASFWRELGRVKKYVAQPLFSIIDFPGLKDLSALAYPLSGEVTGTLSFFNSVNFWQLYGVETGINIDSMMMNYRIADVNLGLYDHEHHGDLGVQKMSFGIIRTFFMQLEKYGIIEFKKNAKISNIFRASFINSRGERESIDIDLTEKMYGPIEKV